jgi:hypothetical protein
MKSLDLYPPFLPFAHSSLLTPLMSCLDRRFSAPLPTASSSGALFSTSPSHDLYPDLFLHRRDEMVCLCLLF